MLALNLPDGLSFLIDTRIDTEILPPSLQLLQQLNLHSSSSATDNTHSIITVESGRAVSNAATANVQFTKTVTSSPATVLSAIRSENFGFIPGERGGGVYVRNHLDHFVDIRLLILCILVVDTVC